MQAVEEGERLVEDFGANLSGPSVSHAEQAEAIIWPQGCTVRPYKTERGLVETNSYRASQLLFQIQQASLCSFCHVLSLKSALNPCSGRGRHVTTVNVRRDFCFVSSRSIGTKFSPIRASWMARSRCGPASSTLSTRPDLSSRSQTRFW